MSSAPNEGSAVTQPLSAPVACRAGGLLPARLGKAVQVPVHEMGKGLPSRPHSAGHVARPDHRQRVSRARQDEVIPRRDPETGSPVLTALAETHLSPLHLAPLEGVSRSVHPSLWRLLLRRCFSRQICATIGGVGIERSSLGSRLCQGCKDSGVKVFAAVTMH